MDSALVHETGRPPKVAIPPRRTSSLIYSRSSNKSQLVKSQSIRREKVRRSMSVTERSEHLEASTCQQTESPRSPPVSPTSPTLFEAAPFSAPPSPTEFPIYLSVDEISGASCVPNQKWPLSVPRLSIPTPIASLANPFNPSELQIPRQVSDNYVLSPNSPNAYSPLVPDYQYFTALSRLHQNSSNDNKQPAPLLLETTLTEATPKRLTSLSKKGVRGTTSTRNKGHKRGKTPLSEAPSKVFKIQGQNPSLLSSSESPSVITNDSQNVSRPRQDSLGSPLRPTRSVRRRKATDGNHLPLPSPPPSCFQPLSEEPTALERKKMPLVTSIAPSPSKVTKTPILLRRFSTRRRRRMEAIQKPLPALPPQGPQHTTPPSTDTDATFASLSSVGPRPMSPVEFEDMNTSPSFPGSSFSPIPSSPWSQIFKRAKSSTKEEKSGFLGKLKGKQKERDMSEDADRVKWREEMRGKIRVLGTVNMTSAFEDD